MTLKALIIASPLAIIMSGCLLANTGEDARPGFTECGDFLADFDELNYCQPGQYCEDPTFSECREGCLSDVNCAQEQRCIKSTGQNLGVCQATIRRFPEGSRAGVTPCGTSFGDQLVCQPGQYCEDSRFNRCILGCLSDANCLSNQSCDKAPGEHEGICVNK